MYCVKCGKQIGESDIFCTNCGQKVVRETKNNSSYNQNINNVSYNNNTKKEKNDKINILLIIVSFIIPLVGLILFIAYNNKSPKFANANGIAALIGFIISMILSFLAIGLLFYYLNNDIIVYDNDDGGRFEYRHYKNDIDDDRFEEEIDEFDKKIEDFFKENHMEYKNGNI